MHTDKERQSRWFLNEGLREEERKGIKKHCREPSTGAIARNQSQNSFVSGGYIEEF